MNMGILCKKQSEECARKPANYGACQADPPRHLKTLCNSVPSVVIFLRYRQASAQRSAVNHPYDWLKHWMGNFSRRGAEFAEDPATEP